MVYFSFAPPDLIRNILVFLLPIMVIGIIKMQLRWREQQRQIAAEREKERQFYLSQVLRAQEGERQRIAQELHDDTTQELLVIANRAQAMIFTAENIGNNEMVQDSEWIKDAALHLSEDVRRISLDLRPGVLDSIGLVSALRLMLARLDEECKIKTKLTITGREKKLNPDIEINIYRIVQEALSNVRQHSNATEAVIDLKYAPEYVQIKVQDNGRGFSLNKVLRSAAVKDRMGIIGMQQRAKLINGVCDIKSSLDKGTCVLVNITNLEADGDLVVSSQR